MTKKDYIVAATLVKSYRYGERRTKKERYGSHFIEDAFVQFFSNDNHRFDELRFRHACNELSEEELEDYKKCHSISVATK